MKPSDEKLLRNTRYVRDRKVTSFQPGCAVSDCPNPMSGYRTCDLCGLSFCYEHESELERVDLGLFFVTNNYGSALLPPTEERFMGPDRIDFCKLCAVTEIAAILRSRYLAAGNALKDACRVYRAVKELGTAHVKDRSPNPTPEATKK